MTRHKYQFACMAIAVGLLSLPSAQAQATGSSPNPRAAKPFSVAQLTASDGVANTFFGSVAALSGNTIAVALEDVVYVYRKSGDTWSDMVQIAELHGSAGSSVSFGEVGVQGDTIVAGGSDGNVYVFVKPTGGWKNATAETAQFLLPCQIYFRDGGGCNYTNGGVAIDKDTIVYGDGFSAFVYVKPAGGWVSTSTYTAQLSPIPTENASLLILSAAISNNTIVLGSSNDDRLNGPAPPAVYLFTKPADGWVDAQETVTLTKLNPGYGDAYETAVIHGDVIAASDTAANNNQGVVDLFVKPATGWTNATESAEITPQAGVAFFGSNIALRDRRLAVSGFFLGADGYAPGSVFGYTRPKNGAWISTSTPKWTLTVGTQAPGQAALPLALGPNEILAGAPNETVNGNADQGAVYVFYRPE